MLMQSAQKHRSMLTIQNLELEIENWIQKNTNTTVAFKSQQSIEFLRQIGQLFLDFFAKKIHV